MTILQILCVFAVLLMSFPFLYAAFMLFIVYPIGCVYIFVSNIFIREVKPE